MQPVTKKLSSLWLQSRSVYWDALLGDPVAATSWLGPDQGPWVLNIVYLDGFSTFPRSLKYTTDSSCRESHLWALPSGVSKLSLSVWCNEKPRSLQPINLHSHKETWTMGLSSESTCEQQGLGPEPSWSECKAGGMKWAAGPCSYLCPELVTTSLHGRV